MRSALIPILIALASACQTTTSDTTSETKSTATMEMNAQRAPELAQLDAFVGRWTGTCTVIEATGEMKEMMSTSDGSAPTFKGGNTTSWGLGGHFLTMDGWHEHAPGQRTKMNELMTWDDNEKRFRVWFFSDMGDYGQGWMTRDGNAFESKYESTKADGSKSTGKSTMTLVNADTMEWTWTETSSKGSLKMTGTNRRE